MDTEESTAITSRAWLRARWYSLTAVCTWGRMVLSGAEPGLQPSAPTACRPALSPSQSRKRSAVESCAGESDHGRRATAITRYTGSVVGPNTCQVGQLAGEHPAVCAASACADSR